MPGHPLRAPNTRIALPQSLGNLWRAVFSVSLLSKHHICAISGHSTSVIVTTQIPSHQYLMNLGYGYRDLPANKCAKELERSYVNRYISSERRQ